MFMSIDTEYCLAMSRRNGINNRARSTNFMHYEHMVVDDSQPAYTVQVTEVISSI